MANSVTVGLGLAVLGYGGRYIARFYECSQYFFQKIFSLRTAPQLVTKLESATRAIDFQLPKFDMKAWENSKYHKGGFEGKMTRREAALILGISPNSDAKKIRDAHKRVMLYNLFPKSLYLLCIVYLSFRWWSWTTLIEEEALIWHQKSMRQKIFLANRKSLLLKPLQVFMQTFCVPTLKCDINCCLLEDSHR